MNKMTIIGIWFLSLLINSGCNRDLVEYDSNDLKISIEKGEEWLHNFPLFLGINIKNPPQIAIWTEDMEGNYLSTVYVTHKIATQSWQASGGNRRRKRCRIGVINGESNMKTGYISLAKRNR